MTFTPKNILTFAFFLQPNLWNLLSNGSCVFLNGISSFLRSCNRIKVKWISIPSRIRLTGIHLLMLTCMINGLEVFLIKSDSKRDRLNQSQINDCSHLCRVIHTRLCLLIFLRSSLTVRTENLDFKSVPLPGKDLDLSRVTLRTDKDPLVMK